MLVGTSRLQSYVEGSWKHFSLDRAIPLEDAGAGKGLTYLIRVGWGVVDKDTLAFWASLL